MTLGRGVSLRGALEQRPRASCVALRAVIAMCDPHGRLPPPDYIDREGSGISDQARGSERLGAAVMQAPRDSIEG